MIIQLLSLLWFLEPLERFERSEAIERLERFERASIRIKLQWRSVERGADGELVELPEFGESDRIVLGLGRELRVDRHRCGPLPVRSCGDELCVARALYDRRRCRSASRSGRWRARPSCYRGRAGPSCRPG
jgi:hypothetical protein